MSQGGALSSSGSGGTSVETVTGNSGGPVGPDAAFNIDVLGNNGTGIDVVGTPASSTLTIIGLPSSDTQVGTVELSTDSEAVTGTDNTRAVSPSNLPAVFASPFPIGSTTPNTGVFTQVDVDNIRLNGNTISTTNTNGNLLLAPDGIGAVAIPSNQLYVGSSAPANPYDISIEGSVAGLTGQSIQNTLVNAAAGVNLQLITEPLAGDAFVLYTTNGAATYSTGIDNSDSDSFKITTGSSPSAGTTALNITTAGIVTLPGGPLDVPSGGTGLSSITDHAVMIGSGTGAITPVGPVAATGALLASNGVGSDPGFTTATYPLTTTANELLYSSATNTVTGLSTANRGVLTTGATGIPSITAIATDGQFIIGSTAGAPAAGTITSTGGSITVTGGSNTINLEVAGGSAINTVNSQVFTVDGTYTPTSGMVYCTIEVIGGGGGSGGCATTLSGQVAASAGGGGGGYSRIIVDAATIGASQTVTVGTGGSAGAAGTNNGGTGGTTSVGAIVSATGGTGGLGAGAAGTGDQYISIGGTGGLGSGGDFNVQGGPGAVGWAIGTGGGAVSGFGGNSVLGGGPRSLQTGAAVAGTQYGSGAAGGGIGASTTQIAGAAGADGIVIITEFIS